MKITQANIDLLWQMVKTDFKIRYNNSVLGFIWVLLKPFLLFLILYLVFSFLFARGDAYYSLRLFLGLIIFSYFSEGTMHGLNSLLSKANIILKVNFPRQIVITASIINSFITLLISFVIFIVFWLFNPTPITPLWLLFPVYLLILTVFIIGLSFFFSIIYVRLRDLQNIWEVLLQMLFWGSAIFYPISILPPKLQFLIFFNPVFVVIYQSRQILIDNQMPDLKFLAILAVASAVLFVAGYFFFKKNIKKIAEYF